MVLSAQKMVQYACFFNPAHYTLIYKKSWTKYGSLAYYNITKDG